VKQRAQSFADKMATSNLSQQAGIDAMEIIPYEEVWKIIIERLHSRSTKAPMKIIA
jgi:hypothetical protein